MTPSIAPGAKRRCQQIISRIPGWSSLLHYCFFSWLLRNHSIKDILVLGVYWGRDIAFIQDILKWEHPTRNVKITGVDLFSDGPCADWPAEKRGMTWEQAGMGKPPNYEAAVKNCPGATIIKIDDAEFLRAAKERFGLVYIDTSHDYETVARQLKQVPRVCRKGAIVAGDDFLDSHRWGVVRAVKEAAIAYETYGEYLFYTRVENLKSLK